MQRTIRRVNIIDSFDKVAMSPRSEFVWKMFLEPIAILRRFFTLTGRSKSSITTNDAIATSRSVTFAIAENDEHFESPLLNRYAIIIPQKISMSTLDNNFFHGIIGTTSRGWHHEFLSMD